MERSTIHLLHKRGKSQREIASELGRSRSAVARALSEPVDRQPTGRRRKSSVDAFREQITEWLKQGLSGVRMMELAREDPEHPYGGRGSVWRAAVRRERLSLLHEQAVADVPIRFEGLPGEYLQVDWGEIRHFPFTQQSPVTRYFLACRLKYSRWTWVIFTDNMRQETLFRGLVACFNALGFVPWVLVFDNMKTVTTGRNDQQQPIWHRALLQLAAEFDFHPEAYWPASGNQKPRVERQVPFVRESFWTGRAFGSLEEINTGAERWCLRVAGPRDHGTTHAPPLLLFQTIEQSAMLGLPTTPFEIVTWARAKVGRDCHAQVQNSLYSIPSRYVGQRLDVRLGAKIVRFYAGTELAKTHLRGKPGQRQTDWNDYPPEKAAFFQRTPSWCREQASQLGEHVRAAVDELLDQHHLHFLRQSQGIIRLAEKYGETRLDAACQRALAYGNPHYRTIKTILEKGLEPHPAEPAPPGIASVGAYLHGPGALLGMLGPVQQEVSA